MKEMEAKQTGHHLPILQKMDLLVKATANFSFLMSAAEKNSLISKLEKDTIVSCTKKKKVHVSTASTKIG